MDRRDFLKSAGVVMGVSAVRRLAGAAEEVSIVIDPADPIASAAPVAWAVDELRRALDRRGSAVTMVPRIDAARAGSRTVVVAAAGSMAAQGIFKAANVTLASAGESLCLVPGAIDGRPALLASGSDVRGVVYAVLELADRAAYADSTVDPLMVPTAIVEQPANTIRSCARCFESDIEDKAWFYDRGHWTEYLSMLAAHRYNRFNLTFGLGYNSARNVPDAYFYFAYPFLLAVAGYDVKAVGLPDAERDRNLDTLRFISDETVKRGLQFNLALWSHAYEWPNPDTNYRISGLTAETHAPYCRDALAALLKACPNITGLSFRMHGESGIPDGKYEFWETLFAGIKSAGRKIDIDQHAKSTDQRHIDIGLSTGNPVSMVPKFWAEHLGMPYHQAAIRELERQGARPGEPLNAATTRRFLRYGYGDYLKDDRNFGILHRVWPGTQRHVLWGDALMGAAYGRAFSFAGSAGVELFEPLSFKGRMGSGKPGGRNAYADKALDPKYDWQKFEYQYRVWGRLVYNPATDADGWRRYLRQQLGPAAEPAEKALASASRILPIITTAHDPSASNNSYWPELYTNMPIVDSKRAQPYSDTPEPRKFGTVSALDPQLFASVEECADALVSGTASAKYTPLDVAQWLEDLARAASEQHARALASARDKQAPQLRRVLADVAIQAGTGTFFAHKLRSAVLWSLHEQSADRAALTEAVKAYRAARQAWAAMAEQAKAIYVADITYGPNANMRGHWIDRLPGIDADLADMEKRLMEPAGTAGAALDPAIVQRAIKTVLAPPQRPSLTARHTPARRFDPGKPLDIALALDRDERRTVKLRYRQADQSQSWRSADMTWGNEAYRGAIPAEYTSSPYPLLYYFEVYQPGGTGIYPGFGPDLSGQPYFLVRSTRADSTTA
ncbi:MAG: hypothetical protein DMF84_28390 [Acidobacteria bacterium]|nr:MAG: hypothetical protein DMF84_28390 [Acidobacteriota bacterium]